MRTHLPDFIQTPALAWTLQPLCRTLDWRGFVAANAVAEMLGLIVAVEIIARAWAPKFLSPGRLILLLAAIIASEPLREGLQLGQVSLVILALIVVGLAGAQRPSAPAGLALATAAAVKLAPGALALHLAAARKWPAAAWFSLWSLGYLALAWWVGGPATFWSYVRVVGPFSRRLVIGLHNQSLAVALTPVSGAILRQIVEPWPPFPAALRALSAALIVGSALLGGLISRRPGRQGEGACFSMIGVTMFAPLAWDHYFVVLIPAVMVLLERPSPRTVAATLSIFALAVLPVDVLESWSATPHLAFRPLFLAGLIALAALALKPRAVVAQSPSSPS